MTVGETGGRPDWPVKTGERLREGTRLRGKGKEWVKANFCVLGEGNGGTEDTRAFSRVVTLQGRLLESETSTDPVMRGHTVTVNKKDEKMSKPVLRK